MTQENTKLCYLCNTNNNDFISTLIAPPATSAESCDINTALLNLAMKDQFSGTPNEDATSHLTQLCDMQKKKYVDNDVVKLKLFPFSLRDRAKIWFLLRLAVVSILGIRAKMLLLLSIFRPRKLFPLGLKS